MFKGMVIRKCLLPAAVVVAEVKLSQNNTLESQGNVCRPSELPIYTPDQQISEDVPKSTETNIVETSFKNARKLLTQYSEEIRAYEKVAKDSFNESKQNVEWLVDYLRQEDNMLPKAGAIGIGVLTGLIFGLRGGFFKRTIYATTGGLGMAAICYPKEASEYTRVGITESKKYLTIAYNFAYGVKKDDPPLELPTLPSNFSEAWDSIKGTASSIFSDKSTQQETPVNGHK
ncbi:MICOS complex subunit 26/27 [Rhynchophorus ferrugineus]|uniref:MICOS complex subunit 26/27 n=1 Tax=Rhynchophorus ferrugineus TaxID=354439 RepID=UPI003FCDEFC5